MTDILQSIFATFNVFFLFVFFIEWKNLGDLVLLHLYIYYHTGEVEQSHRKNALYHGQIAKASFTVIFIGLNNNESEDSLTEYYLLNAFFNLIQFTHSE